MANLAQGTRSLAVAALIGLLALQAFALLRAPAAWTPEKIKVRLAAGESLAFSRGDLAAVQTEGAQLLLRRDAAGAWFLRQSGTGQPPLLQSMQGEERLGSIAAGTLRSFRIGAQRFDSAFSEDVMRFTSTPDKAWSYDGATLRLNGEALADCPDTALHQRAAALWNRIAPAALTIARPLVFGGNLYCGNRLGLAAIPASAAVVSRSKGELRLSAVAAGFIDVSATPAAGPAIRLRDDERGLAGMHALTFGRTRYTLSLQGNELTLLPQRRAALYGAPEARLPEQVDWQWQQRALWTASHAGLWAGLAVALMALWLLKLAASATTARPQARGNILSGEGARREKRQLPRNGVVRLAMLASVPWRGADGVVRDLDEARRARSRAAALLQGLRTPMAWLAAAAITLCGMGIILMARTGQPPAASASLLLLSCTVALWLLATPRLPLACAAALVLCAAGTLSQLELGLAGMDTAWLRYYQKTTALFAIGSGIAIAWQLWQRPRRRALPQRWAEWLFALLAAIALLALGAQVIWGDETGVFDLQPVELAKLALTALTAHCLALRLGWRADAGRAPGHLKRWLRLAAPALLFIALLGLALVQVDDYSPLLLLMIWSAAMLLAYAIAARNWWLAAVPVLLATGCAAAVLMLRIAGPEQMAALPGAFYADRFQVWLDPAHHPHTGQQLLQGATAVAEGSWRGADGLFGITTLGQPAPSLLAIPAVQDDFAPSFLLNRHGLLAGLLLWGTQAAFIIGLLYAAIEHGRRAAPLRDFRLAWQYRLRSFLLCGGAAFVAGHLLLSWGTNLAIFPIMGQPMSFLSAGGSHLLFFLLPLLGISAASASTEEE
jgi:cell division protein FtsW